MRGRRRTKDLIDIWTEKEKFDVIRLYSRSYDRALRDLTLSFFYFYFLFLFNFLNDQNLLAARSQNPILPPPKIK